MSSIKMRHIPQAIFIFSFILPYTQMVKSIARHVPLSYGIYSESTIYLHSRIAVSKSRHKLKIQI